MGLAQDLQAKVKGLNLSWSALQASHEQIFRDFLSMIKPKIAMEIGTFQGIATALIAQYADKVYTVDVMEYPMQEEVWKVLNVRDKIIPKVVKCNPDKKAFIDASPFDFAFIDGGHLYENVEVDFDFVSKCKKVLFHDYGFRGWTDVKQFCDDRKLKLNIVKPFAYWSGEYLP